MNTLKPLPSFCGNLINSFPSVFVEGMSYEEMLLKIQGALNSVIDSQNSTIENVNELEGDFITLKKYIDDYFNNLDVQDEINLKLDELVSNGTMSSLLKPLVGDWSAPIIVNSTSEMSDKNKIYILSTDGFIYQWDGQSWKNSGLKYGLDTHTIQTGTTYITSKSWQSVLTDINDAPFNTIYICNVVGDSAPANFPFFPSRKFNGFSMLVTLQQSGARTQFLFTQYDGIVSRFYSGGSWSQWSLYGDVPAKYISTGTNFITSKTWQSVLTDINDAPFNTIYICNVVGDSAPANFPFFPSRKFNGFSMLVTLQQSGARTQFLFTQYDGIVSRFYSGGSWSQWSLYGDVPAKYISTGTNFITSKTWQSVLTDINDAPFNTIYICNVVGDSAPANFPLFPYFKFKGFSLLFTIHQGGAKSQFLFTQYNGVLSRSFSAGNWGAWNFYGDFEISVGAGKDFEKLSDCLYNIKKGNLKNVNVTVYPGEYNQIEELGEQFFADYSASTYSANRGYPLKNNVAVRFLAGAKVTCNYEGDNNAVKTYWSCFNVEGACKVEFLDARAKNIRYIVHDDSTYTNGNTIFTDSIMIKDDKNIVVGIGFPTSGNMVYKNCVIQNFNATHTFYAHNSNYGGGSNLTISNCKIYGGDLYLQDQDKQVVSSNIIVNNCNLQTQINKVVSGSESMFLFDFNNTIG